MKKLPTEEAKKASARGTPSNKEGFVLNKQSFVFNHLKDKAKIKDYYIIGSVLGAGAYGEVRACTHKKTQHQRAVKIILKSNMSAKEQERLHCEVDILGNMDHPNVVKLYEAF